MLRLRAGNSTAGVRMDAVNACWKYSCPLWPFEKCVRWIRIWRPPEWIYYMDETGVPLEPRPPKIVAVKGQKKGRKRFGIVRMDRNHRLQSLDYFRHRTVEYTLDQWRSGSHYAVCEKGWVDQELFFSLAEGALPAKCSITTPPVPVTRWPQLSFWAQQYSIRMATSHPPTEGEVLFVNALTYMSFM